jgi:outer membrane protein assembly factor BamD (BamD/ComL family)
MKKLIALSILIIATLANTASAQRNVTPAIDRDPIMETDAKHNLDVANQYFKLKKAYKSVVGRFEETYAAYPDFSQIDEFLYIAGMSSLYLSEGKGKQKIDLKTEKEPEKYVPEKLRKDAIRYLVELVLKHPESKFRPDAEKALETLKGK